MNGEFDLLGDHVEFKPKKAMASEMFRYKVKLEKGANEDDTENLFYSRQEYAQVSKALGDCRFNIIDCSGPEKGKLRLGHAIGSITKRVKTRSKTRSNGRGGHRRRHNKPKAKFMVEGDIVLIQLRSRKEKIVDIIDVYNQDDTRILKREGEIGEDIIENEDKEDGEEGGDDGFIFEDI
jgi:hypothetical protein